MSAPAVGAAPAISLDAATRAYVTQLHGCDTSVALAISIIKRAPNNLIRASSTINEAKGICQSIFNRMVSMNDTHFSKQAQNAQIAVDYWTRGCGRFSNYIDNGKPSDVTTAAQYFSTARSFSNLAIRGINQVRAAHGLAPLR